MSHRSSRRPLSFLLALALAAAHVPIVSLAHAEPSAADVETARTMYKEGLELRKGGDEAGALQKFKGAYALTKSPVIGVEVAKSEAALGKLVDAREQALEIDALPTTAKETKASVDARAEARKLAADLKTRIPSVKIRLVDVPMGTKPAVTVDGANVPFEVLGEARAVDPGKHVVAASVGTEPPATKEVTVAEGESQDVTISLAGHEGATTSGTMPMPPTSTTTPISTPPPAPTTTTTTTTKDAGSGGKTSPLTWIGIGLTSVGVAVGTATGIMALSKASTVKDECPNGTCPSSAKSDLDYVHTTATISTIGFAAAGAGVVLFIIGVTSKSKPEPSSSASTTTITPWVGLGSAGVSGAF